MIDYGGFLSDDAAKRAKAKLASYVDTLRPRWKQEAESVIKSFALEVYGDASVWAR